MNGREAIRVRDLRRMKRREKGRNCRQRGEGGKEGGVVGGGGGGERKKERS